MDITYMTTLKTLSFWEKALLHQKEYWEKEKKRILRPLQKG